MGGVEDSQWVDKFMDGIGLAFTKIDETIQKGIELWTELTRVDDQPIQDLTGQPKSGESGEENSSQDPAAEVKERVPVQHCWSMCLSEVEDKPSQHWAMRASKISESFIQVQNVAGDGEKEEEEDEVDSTLSEEDNESSLSRNHEYEQMFKMIRDMYPSEEADNDDGDNEDFDTFSEEDDESWDDEDDTTTSKSSEDMSELNLGASATNYIPDSYHHHNEEDNDSSLKWKGDYQLLKNVDKSSSEEEDDESFDDDEVGECHSEDVKEVMEISWKHIMMSNSCNESLGVQDYEDDVSDKLLLQGFVDVRQEEENGNNTELSEVETLLPESDWVYVTRD
ncbi:PREDICTED: RNA polymerase-associated protein LEO1-like [Camelina sativa]|uniref:RNA polymerase-associated protein LEO1-like n=1 Tax=Camelina sativa TaxID=90675 RepID=A0ABM1Q6X8_CAMSA|nr:PREDICTED: RNA polymerase-associated protein LEO1-like [Camelina sativa]